MSSLADALGAGTAGRYLRLGNIAEVMLGKMLDAGRGRRDGDHDLPYIRAANIQDHGLALEEVKSMPYSADEARLLDLRRGDVLVVEGGAVGTAVVIAEDMPGWSFQKTVNRVRFAGDGSSRWLAYVLRAYRDAGIVDAVCSGSTIAHFTAEKLRALRVPHVAPHEQRAIADYLDRETAQIDTLIVKQEQLIATLRERRQSSIDALFGRNVGEGDRLRWHLLEVDQRAGSLAEELPLLSVSITWGVRRRDASGQGETRADDLSPYKVVRRGDLVVNRMRAFQGALGVAAEDGVVSPDYAVLRPSRAVDADWLAVVMRTRTFVSEMTARLKGIGSADSGTVRTPRINVSDLLDIRAAIPSVERQREQVGDHVTAVGRTDMLISKAERFIELAKERRSALITAAVTGQVHIGAA